MDLAQAGAVLELAWQDAFATVYYGIIVGMFLAAVAAGVLIVREMR